MFRVWDLGPWIPSKGEEGWTHLPQEFCFLLLKGQECRNFSIPVDIFLQRRVKARTLAQVQNLREVQAHEQRRCTCACSKSSEILLQRGDSIPQ